MKEAETAQKYWMFRGRVLFERGIIVDKNTKLDIKDDRVVLTLEWILNPKTVMEMADHYKKTLIKKGRHGSKKA